MRSAKILNSAEKRAAERLGEIWNKKKKSLGLTQASVASKLGLTNQCSVNVYLTGRQALNVKTVLGFSSILGVFPHQIFPEMFENIGDRVDEKLLRLLSSWDSMTTSQQNSLMRVMEIMADGNEATHRQSRRIS